jgi:HlyD family secretion protein
MRKQWIAVTLAVLVVAVPVALSVARGTEAKVVDVMRAEPRVITPSILASGTLVYSSQVTLVSEVLGQIDEVLVEEGDRVTKGQPLLRLNAETSRAELEQLQASRAQSELNIQRQLLSRDAANAKLNRFEELRKVGLIEATRYDEFATQRDLAEVELLNSYKVLKQANAQLEQARQRLAKLEIRAPIDGLVTQVSIKRGETAVPSAMSIAGGSLMVIADTVGMFADVNVDETDIARVAIGQAASIVPAAYPDKSLKGIVEQIALAPKQTPGQNRGYLVRIRLIGTGGVAFHPGMSARAEIATAKGSDRHVGVPVQAVQYAETESKGAKALVSVYVLVDGKAARREVETGAADDSHIEVLKGLAIGDIVIVGPAKTLRFLREGDPAKPKAAAPPDVEPARPASSLN